LLLRHPASNYRRFRRWCSKYTHFYLPSTFSIFEHCKMHFTALGSWNHILTLRIINDNTICNDSGKIYRRAASLLLRNPSHKETNFGVCVRRLLCSLYNNISVSCRSIHRIFWGVMILTFFCFTAFVHTRIYLVIRKLVRSPKKPVSCESTDANQNVTKRQIFRESRHARACFAVVVCFGIFLLPLVLVMVFFNISSTMFYLEYVHWSITSMIFNSTINSLIFFWTNPLLRKEAFRTLRLYYS
jgi:hypothetical protein